MKVIVIGSSGQLGRDLMNVLADGPVIGLDHAAVEIRDGQSLKQIMNEHRPECVINTAAYHNLDACEEDPDTAFAVNAKGAWNVAQACRACGATLVHISTDYVFDGSRSTPYAENDLPFPLNVYGASKLAGEHLVRATLERSFVIRTSGLYGLHPCRAKGYNFVDLMLRLAREREEVRVVTDEVVTPTFTLDLSRQIRSLMESEQYGLYHVTSSGACSWYECARAIFSCLSMDVNLVPTTADEFPRPVRRPAYSVLENKALQKLGIDGMRSWQEALENYLELRQAQRENDAVG